MKLLISELKKNLLIRKGLLVILLCPILSFALFFLFPEIRDERISGSDLQYRKYLEVFYGPDSETKQKRILEEYEKNREVIAAFPDKLEAYQNGEISEEAWTAFGQQYEEAALHNNSLGIFYETAERFLQYSGKETPWYIRESGWNTAFTLLSFPDVFLVFGIVILSVRVFSRETETGMLPVLYTCRNGRLPLYVSELFTVTLAAALTALLGNLSEFLALFLRGFLQDGGVPAYSVSYFSGSGQALSLKETLMTAFTLRFIAEVTLGILAFCLAVLTGRGTLSVFICIAVSLLFLLLTVGFGLSAPLYITGSGMMSASRLMRDDKASERTGLLILLRLAVTAASATAAGALRLSVKPTGQKSS